MTFKKTCHLLILLLIITATSPVEAQMLFNKNTFKLGQTLHHISNDYVEPTEIDNITEQAIIDMLKKLDPHSTYISKEDVKAMNEPLEGNFEGIGVTFNILEDTIYIISPISGGPSEKVGIMAGDRIVTIEGENVAGTNIKSKGVRDRLLGEKGTKVTVGIKRKGNKDLLSFTITRDKIPIYSIDANYMMNDSIGYIKVNRFSRTTMNEFFEAFEELEKKGMNNLILDLSGNGGGYLEVAVRLADQLLSDEKLLVYTEGENSPRYEHTANDPGRFEEGKLAILIDEGSASASEIVSGAVQDWDRGVIIGRRSFGKGLVQKPFMLSDSSLIRLTIARYHTPTGRMIQKPYKKGYEAYRKDIINRFNKGELMSQDSIHFPDSLKYKTLRNKRPVYGGGGIMPDFFIPLDTTHITDFYRKIMSHGFLNRFVLNYVDDHRKELDKKYPEFAQYKAHFTVPETLVNKLVQFAEEEGLTPLPDELESSKKQIKHVIKSYIARDLWEMNEFHQIFNKENETIQEAFKILQSNKRYRNILTGK